MSRIERRRKGDEEAKTLGGSVVAGKRFCLIECRNDETKKKAALREQKAAIEIEIR